MIGWQIARTSSSATALRTTSGPMPAGSPMVIPMRGLARRAKPAGGGVFIDRIVVGFTFGRYAILRRWVHTSQGLRFNCMRRDGRDKRELVLHPRNLRHALVGLVDVLNVALKHQEIGRRFAIDLQCTPIVPLNCSLNLFTILQHQNHLSVSINLLLVVINLSVSFVWWWLPF